MTNIDNSFKCYERSGKYIIYWISSKDISAILYYLNMHFETMRYYISFNSVIQIDVEERNLSTLIKIHFNYNHLITIDYSKFRDIITNNIYPEYFIDNYCYSDDTLVYQIIPLILIVSIIIILGFTIIRMLKQVFVNAESNTMLDYGSNEKSYIYEFNKH